MSQYKPALFPLALPLLDTRCTTSIIRWNSFTSVQPYDSVGLAKIQMMMAHGTWYSMGSALYLYQDLVAHQELFFSLTHYCRWHGLAAEHCDSPPGPCQTPHTVSFPTTDIYNIWSVQMDGLRVRAAYSSPDLLHSPFLLWASLSLLGPNVAGSDT